MQSSAQFKTPENKSDSLHFSNVNFYPKMTNKTAQITTYTHNYTTCLQVSLLNCDCKG